jgi:uncharacterized protein involved in type VI secretion and phage assembly
MTEKRIPGVVVGTVVNVIDPQNQGRVMVSFPWLDDTLKSTWASMVAPFAGNDRGIRGGSDKNGCAGCRRGSSLV